MSEKVSIFVSTLLAVSGIAIAAQPDLRLVNAAADQDKTLVRTLLKQGADVNVPRADGSFCGPPIGRTSRQWIFCCAPAPK
jgi:hypothetical protein